MSVLDDQFEHVTSTFNEARAHIVPTNPWIKRLTWLWRILLCLLLIFVGALLLFWLYWPWNVLHNYYAHAANQNGASGNLVYTIKYCRNSPVPSTIFRTVQGVNGTHYVYSLPAVGSSVANGCGVTMIPVHVGVPIHPGTYRIEVQVKFQINPLRTLVYPVQTNIFTVS
jgi:hypothetical protein